VDDIFDKKSGGPLDASIVLWGVGNPLGRDDGAGVRLAEALISDPPRGIEVVVCETVPENYLAPLRRRPPERLLVVDAADMGLRPGAIRRLEAEDILSVSWGTHGTPLPRLLSPLGLRVTFIGVQPLDRSLGTTLSPPVATAVSCLERIVRRRGWDLISPIYQEKRSPR